MPHDQIVWSDPASIAQVRDYLHRELRRRYSGVEEQVREESIEDALMHYQRDPQSFDASRGSLYFYLEMRTRHYLDKLLQKANRRREREKAIGVWDKNFEKIVSETRGGRGINIGKKKTEKEAAEEQEEAERRKEVLDAILASLNPHDRAGVELLRIGASREEWIRHLGIESLPEKEQQRKIYAEKDRMKKKLKRRAQQKQGD